LRAPFEPSMMVMVLPPGGGSVAGFSVALAASGATASGPS